MKTVAKINPQLEFDYAKSVIEAATSEILGVDRTKSLNKAVENLFNVTQVLMDRLDRNNRRSPKKKAQLIANPTIAEIDRILINYLQKNTPISK